MNKNPFSIYDFLGYLVPGMISLIVLLFFLGLEPASNKDAAKQSISFINIFQADNNKLMEVLIFILASYVIGHIINYLSSLTVEKHMIWMFGYPSSFLLAQKKTDSYYSVFRKYKIINEKQIHTGVDSFFLRKTKINDDYLKFNSLLCRIVIILLVFPIFICDVIICEFLYFKNSYIRPLDNYTIIAVHDKLLSLIKILKLRDPEDGCDSDFHRIIYHYVFENNKNHQSKFDNYVALYGFLRTIAFIFSSIGIMSITLLIFRRHSEVVVFYKYIALFSVIISYIAYMGFLKFYRRFTLESFMCLITSKDI